MFVQSGFDKLLMLPDLKGGKMVKRIFYQLHWLMLVLLLVLGFLQDRI